MMRGKVWNENWQFHLGDVEEAHLPSKGNANWKEITLPHDFSASFSFDEEEGHGCTAYLLGGVAWYRKFFETTEEMYQKKFFVSFDGIYERATIYCNGKVVAFHPYGYSPCLLDFSDCLKPLGEENIIAVYVDHSRDLNSRWYTGSGIYRSVCVHSYEKTYIPLWGIKLKTEDISEDNFKLISDITLENEENISKKLSLTISCFNFQGEQVFHTVENIIITGKEKKTLQFQYIIKNTVLWEIFEGKQYTFKVKLTDNENILQEKEEKFGVRSFYFDPEDGFYFNGKKNLIKGVCLHHDCGALGVAVPLDGWKRRLMLLKNMGCNAIRTAHNPVSEDFLALCDHMGLLVQEEFFDEWDNPKDKRTNCTEKVVDYRTRSYTEFFREYGKSDLQAVISRDFNHPSIFQWSIGNEIEWCYPKYNKAPGYFSEVSGTQLRLLDLPRFTPEEIRENIGKIPKDYYDVGSTAEKLASWVKEIDKSRPVIANLLIPASSYETGYVDALDMVGFSYRGALYHWAKEHYPHKAMMGTENVCQYHEWKSVLDNPHVAGVFLWMGIDHLGEAWVQKGYPRKSSNLGLFDLACHPKPCYYMYESLWSGRPVIHFETQTLEKSLYELDSHGKLIEKQANRWREARWHWQDVNPFWNDYSEGDLVVVEIYSNCDEMTLFCNETQIATEKLKNFPDHIYKFLVPYSKGTLKAKGMYKNQEVLAELSTEGIPEQLQVSLDKEILDCHPDSLLHIEVQLEDIQGNPVRNEEKRVKIQLNDCGTLVAIDNGNPDCVEDFQNNNSILTWHGKCIFYVKGCKKGILSGTISFDQVTKDFSLEIIGNL